MPAIEDIRLENTPRRIGNDYFYREIEEIKGRIGGLDANISRILRERLPEVERPRNPQGEQAEPAEPAEHAEEAVQAEQAEQAEPAQQEWV